MDRVYVNQARFAGYEYMEINANEENASMYLDGYLLMGWVIDESVQSNATYNGKKILLKRDRKIVNRMELTRLQNHFEVCMKEISSLELSKTTKATMYALIIGMLGAACLVGATLAAFHVPPQVLLCVILAIPGLIGCTISCVAYKRMVASRTMVVTEMINRKYDELHEVLDKAKKLID